MKFQTYLIKNNRTGLHKIGRSRNPQCRLTQIDQIKGDCELLLTIDKDCEALLHNCFYDKRVGSEWFNLTENEIGLMIEYINGINKLTIPFDLLGQRFEIIRSNKLVSLHDLSLIRNEQLEIKQSTLTQMINSDESKIFINELSKQYEIVVSNSIGNRSTFVNLLLFLEIARNLNPKIKIAIYELLIGSSQKVNIAEILSN